MIIRVIRTFSAWCFTCIFWIPSLFLYVLILRRIPDEYVHAGIHFWAKTTLKILSIRIEFMNQSTLADRRPRVIICNHQSALDILWGAFIAPPSLLVIGKREIAFVPVFNLVWWAFKFIRIDRANSTKALASLEGVSEKIVSHSRSLFIAPEGTRTHDGSILPFKKGAFYIAQKGHIPIYPVVVSGAFELLPRNAFFPKSGTIQIEFLAPIETRDFSIAELGQIIERIRIQMIEAYQRQQTNLPSRE